MRSRALHYHPSVFKQNRDTGKEILFLGKRHGEREMEKLKAIAHHLHEGTHSFLLVKLMQPPNFARPRQTFRAALCSSQVPAIRLGFQFRINQLETTTLIYSLTFAGERCFRFFFFCKSTGSLICFLSLISCSDTSVKVISCFTLIC